MGPIRYSALRAKASPRKVAAWRESVLRETAHDDRGENTHGSEARGPALRASTWVGVVAALTLVCGALSVAAGILELTDRGNTGGLSAAALLATLALGLSWVVLQRRVRQLAEGWRDPYRLMSFARDNGFHAVPVATPADLPGRIFGRGLDEHRVRLDVVAWVQGGRQCHVATECWSSGEPRGGGTPLDEGSCRYLAVRIGQVPLPFAEFTAFDTETQEPPVSDRQLVRATAGTERWAASLFSERVTTLLTHSRQPRDAEIVGEWFIAYDLTDADPLSPSGWERTFQLVAALPAFPVAPPNEDGSDPLTSPEVAKPTGRVLTMRMPRPWRRPVRAM
ncbi:hypothetical protein MWU75_17640 [Ornithinimicrobium sp. F0845]|uniref:hypothetical protein n=1 Tax=Ornithinimicrobium sp. F0845 TaxID=2926412 RepID=UPI001FF1B641|nr:hypothetical protein [Ornithinimicrobium sp. F0845]MCK0113968.1 hypothetical protein [Ornithinimicrobium sp. F0845]